MKINNAEMKLEMEWLEKVLVEVRKQLEEKREFKEDFKKDAIETQRELWQEVGSISIANNLDQLVDFLGYIDVMKRQKRSHDFTAKLQQKYEKLLLSPYFGRIDFHETGEDKAEKFYIGIANLINDHYDFLVYDWRAPVCSMFYDYEIGEASYKCPEGTISGDLSLKRQYKINNDKIEYMFDSNLKIDDEILQDILGKSTDSKMKTIVTTIQREQNKVIRNEEYKNLIVQGPAGSGKTSIALHRIAYLLYKHRDKITPENIIIFSPNQIFNDYISNVLPELGEDNIGQTTFKEYMHKSLGSEFILEDYCDMMEAILEFREKPTYEQRIRNIKYKSSIEFKEILKQYVADVEKVDRNFTDIILRGKLIVSAKELEELFYKDYSQLPLKKGLNKLKERILFLLKPYEKALIREGESELRASGSYIDQVEIAEISISAVKGEAKEIYEEIHRMTEFDLVDLYKKLFEKLEIYYSNIDTENFENKTAEEDLERKTDKKDFKKEINEIKRYTLDNLKAHKLYYEDQPALLYLKGALGDLPRTSEIKYVIIDEAQDYSPLQYQIFDQLFHHANITMLGDLNQSINPFMNVGDYSNIADIFPQNNTCRINLTKSYRSTMEITAFSRRLLNKEITDQYVERSGDKPLVTGFLNEEAIKEKILEDIKTYKELGYKSIGVITRTISETKEVYGYLKDRVTVRSIINDEAEYKNDTLVIPAHLAKGLEFDVVLIYNAGDGNYYVEEERLLFYTACTRALHVLHVYYTGEHTPLLNGIC